MFVYIYGLNSHIKCSFKSILDKKDLFYPIGPLITFSAFMKFTPINLGIFRLGKVFFTKVSPWIYEFFCIFYINYTSHHLTNL